MLILITLSSMLIFYISTRILFKRLNEMRTTDEGHKIINDYLLISTGLFLCNLIAASIY